MKLTSTFLGVAATAALTATTLSAGPASAFTEITLGSSVSFANLNGGTVGFNPSTGAINFNVDPVTGLGSNQSIGVSAGTGSFSEATSFPLALAQIEDLTLTQVGSSSTYTYTGLLTNFLSQINLADNLVLPIVGEVTSGIGKPQFPQLSFDLTSFVFDFSTGDAKVDGIFRAIDSSGTTISSMMGTGVFTTQLNSINPTTWSMGLTAVPTPALVPAAVGFCAAMLRKRKGEKAEESVGTKV